MSLIQLIFADDFWWHITGLSGFIQYYPANTVSFKLPVFWTFKGPLRIWHLRDTSADVERDREREVGFSSLEELGIELKVFILIRKVGEEESLTESTSKSGSLEGEVQGLGCGVNPSSRWCKGVPGSVPWCKGNSENWTYSVVKNLWTKWWSCVLWKLYQKSLK